MDRIVYVIQLILSKTFSILRAAILLFLLFTCVASANVQVSLQWFYTEGCYHCGEVKQLVSRLEQVHPRLRVERLEIANLENYKRLIALERRYGVTASAPMVIFVGTNVLIGHAQIQDDLEHIVNQTLAQPAAVRDTVSKTAAHPVILTSQEVASRVRPWLVATAGIIDGINPCAFATIVFLISILAVQRLSQFKLLQAGLSFSAAVFLAYFLMGLGAFKCIHQLDRFYSVSNAVYGLIAAGAFVLGILSLRDAWRYYRNQDASAMALKIPEAWRDRMHIFLRQWGGGRLVLPGCFISGLVVSVIEVVCTGQIYLPTIMILTQDQSTRAQGLGYLLLYNVMFILPLLAVMGLFLTGIKLEQFIRFSRRSVVLAKCGLALSFFALGAIMIIVRMGR